MAQGQGNRPRAARGDHAGAVRICYLQLNPAAALPTVGRREPENSHAFCQLPTTRCCTSAVWHLVTRLYLEASDYARALG